MSMVIVKFFGGQVKSIEASIRKIAKILDECYN